MNKKLLTVAVGAALVAAPMMAAQADVTIGGSLNMSADYIDTNDSATASTTDYKKKWNVSSNSSNIVINASHDLGNGMKGVAHLQEFFRMDNLGSSSTSTCTNSAAGETCTVTTTTSNRQTAGNAHVGLQTSMGSLKMGSNDSMAKLNGRAYDLFGNSLGDSRNLGMANTRAQNVVWYESPTMAGVSGVVAKVTNADNTTNATAGSTTATTVLVKYAGGPATVGVAMDSFNNALDTKVINVGAGFTAGPAKIVAMYQKTSDVSATYDEQTVVGLGASFGFDKHTVKAQVYKVTDVAVAAGTADTEATMAAVGYDYAFSKSFKGYVVYAQTEDDLGGAAMYGMAGGGHGDAPAAISGETQNGIGLGFAMSF